MSDAGTGRGAHHAQDQLPSADAAATSEPLVSLHAALLADGRREVWLELHAPAKRISPEQAQVAAGLLVDIAAAASTASNAESQLSGQAGSAASMPPEWDRVQQRAPIAPRQAGRQPETRRNTGEVPAS